MESNKYKGNCNGCGVAVAAGECFYNGGVWCEEPKVGYDFGFNDPTHACSRYHAREERLRAEAVVRRAEYEASPEYAEKLAESAREAHGRADAETVINAQGRKTCNRCGGAGRSDRWCATGNTCFKCEGSGTVEMSEREVKRFAKAAK